MDFVHYCSISSVFVFQGGFWKCYHLDDLHEEVEPLPSWKLMKTKTVGEMFLHSVDGDGERMQDTLHRTLYEDVQQNVYSSDRDEEGNDDNETTADVFQTWLRDFDEYDEAATSDSESLQEVETDELVEMSESVVSVAPYSKLNVDYLIKNCLHKAVASLVDDEKVGALRSRKTQRLNLLIRLLDDSSFMNAGES